mmetsp:Transcript_23198/g.55008  ORF Transcript_23198/g.55008 Transcript_23198/m.55008 type:complete len:432 (-) Transcript_23198:139-1434(-)
MKMNSYRKMLNCFFLFVMMTMTTQIKEVASIESPYLKEILMGRCYEQSLSTSSNTKHNTIEEFQCDGLVGGFMNVLESRTQQDISSDDFSKAYVEQTDFTSPHDAALIWLPALTNLGATSISLKPTIRNSLVTPHDTPGGKLITGLVFCAAGSTSKATCTQDESNAYWQFWKASYTKFSSQITGTFRVVIENQFDDVDFLKQNVLAVLDVDKVSSIEIWTPDSSATEDPLCSSKAALKIMDYLTHVKKFSEESVSCQEDLVEMTLCHNDPMTDLCLEYQLGKGAMSQNKTLTPLLARTHSNSSSSSSPSTKKHWPDETGYYRPGDLIDDNSGHRSPFRTFLVWLAVGSTAYCLYTRILHNQNHHYGYTDIGNGKRIEADGDDDDGNSDNAPSAQSFASLRTGGSGNSNGAESFFLNDPEYVGRDDASRSAQ